MPLQRLLNTGRCFTLSFGKGISISSSPSTHFSLDGAVGGEVAAPAVAAAAAVAVAEGDAADAAGATSRLRTRAAVPVAVEEARLVLVALALARLAQAEVSAVSLAGDEWRRAASERVAASL